MKVYIYMYMHRVCIKQTIHILSKNMSQFLLQVDKTVQNFDSYYRRGKKERKFIT